MSPSTSQGPESQVPVIPSKNKLDELEECNSAKFLECDTHLKAALYSVRTNERKKATDSIERVRRLVKGHMAKADLLIKEVIKKGITADKREISDLKKNKNMRPNKDVKIVKNHCCSVKQYGVRPL